MEKEQLLKLYKDVYDTTELTTNFEVISFLAPFVSVIKKDTKQKGTLEFQHNPRYYFNFIISK